MREVIPYVNALKGDAFHTIMGNNTAFAAQVSGAAGEKNGKNPIKKAGA